MFYSLRIDFKALRVLSNAKMTIHVLPLPHAWPQIVMLNNGSISSPQFIDCYSKVSKALVMYEYKSTVNS
jgi:hypothetical protein